MKKKSFVITAIILTLFLISIIWLSVSTAIQRFKCSSMTETQLFLNIPNSFVGNWKKCN